MRYAVMSAFCHMETDELERYSTRQVSAEEMDEFEDHLLICEACRLRFEESETYVAAMRVAATQLHEESERKRSWWTMPRLVPVLAGLALLVIGFLTISRFTGSSAPPLALTLTATRGTAPGGSVPSGRAIDLTPDLTGITSPGPYQLEIVDALGRVTWKGGYNAASGAAKVPGQTAGPHFVRIYSQGGELLREYGLDVQR
jgi:hypothetical protein